MESIDILYFIEHAARELDTACAINYLAHERHGISIEIRSIVMDLEKTLAHFEPKIVVLPYCVSVKDLNMERIVRRWPAASYLNLSYEQLLGKAQKQFKAPRDEFARNYVLHHAWGEFFKEFLLESGVPESNIEINGNPSYALYHDPYKKYYGNPKYDLGKQFGLDPEKRWVFVPENYGWAFFKNHMLRDRIRRGFDAEQAYVYRDFSVDSLQTAAEWWCAGAELDGTELIVRPRPAIPRNNFVERMQKMVGILPEHLHIIKHGSVREWILASDIVFSSYSTTLLEAANAEKPLYMLMPYTFPEFIHVDWNEQADKVETLDAFLKAIQKPELDQNWISLKTWVNETMMSQEDPIANLVEILVKILGNKFSIPQPLPIAKEINQPTFDKIYLPLRKFGWDALQGSLSLLGIKTQAQDWNPHETDMVSTNDVIDRVGRWKSVLN